VRTTYKELQLDLANLVQPFWNKQINTFITIWFQLVGCNVSIPSKIMIKVQRSVLSLTVVMQYNGYTHWSEDLTKPFGIRYKSLFEKEATLFMSQLQKAHKRQPYYDKQTH
jgi:hypothetical protein